MGHEEVVDVTIEAVRDRFHTLNVPLAFFDGPAGTQCPDSVIESVSGSPAPANIANQIYSQATMAKMIAQCTQSGKTIDQAMDWAASELEGFMRS